MGKDANVDMNDEVGDEVGPNVLMRKYANQNAVDKEKDVPDAEEVEKFDDEVPSSLPPRVLPEDCDRNDVYSPEAHDNNVIQYPWDVPYTIYSKPMTGFGDIRIKPMGDKHRYLNYCCLRPTHRSNVVLDGSTLQRNNCHPWWLLNADFARDTSGQEVKTALLKVFPSLAKLSHVQRKVAFSRLLFGNLDGYLAKKRSEMDMIGFTTFNGVLGSHNLTEEEKKSIGVETMSDTSRMSAPVVPEVHQFRKFYLEYCEKTFKSHLSNMPRNCGRRRSAPKGDWTQPHWTDIRNRTKDLDDNALRRKLIRGRFQQTRFGCMGGL